MVAGRTLAGQLGLSTGIRCWFHNLPDALGTALDAAGVWIEEQPTASDGLQCAMLCVGDGDTLRRELAAVAPLMATNGFIWVWRPQGVAALEQEKVADLAGNVNLVIADTCRFDEKWSGLKLIAQ